MYTVISGYKHASWVRTTSATGLLLAVCAGLAWLWIGRPAPEVALDQRYASPNWPLVLHVPDGWVAREGTAPSGRRIVLLSDGPEGEFLHVTRRESSSFHPPDGALARTAALDDLIALGSEGILGVDPPTATPFGPLPGAMFAAQAPSRDGDAFYICAVGCSPDGAIYSAVLRPSGQRLHAATRLLTQIVERAEVTEPILETADDFNRSPSALQFDVPAGTRFFRPGRIDDAETVRCLSPRASNDPWQIDVTRTWLTEGHSAALLVEHRFGEKTYEVDAKAESVALDRGTVYRIGQADPDAREALEVWTVTLGEHRAALIAGHGGPRAKATLQRVCRSVAETVRDGTLPPVDVPQAVRRGRDVVREIRKRGLSAWWGKRSADEWYIESRAGRINGFERSRRRPSDDEPDAYELDHVAFSRGRIQDIALHYSARWIVGADASGERGAAVFWYALPSQNDVVLRASDVQPRNASTRQRRRELAGRSIDDVISVGEAFVGESAIEIARFLVARHPERGPAVFTASGPFDHTGDTHSVLCIPLGRRPETASDPRPRPWRLLVRHDYSSRYELLQFADDGSLTRQEVPPWSDLHVARRQDVEREFDVESILKELESVKIPKP